MPRAPSARRSDTPAHPGSVFSDGSLFALSTPHPTSLEVEIGYDVHGVVGSNIRDP
ncbi:hypothetical protein ACFQ9X_20740 [Catenulispora yoronensis]